MATIATQPTQIRTPIPVSTNYVFPIRMFSDAAKRKPKDITGATITMLILNPDVTTVASAVTYTASAVSASLGQAQVQIAGASHTALGVADAQVHVGGVLRARFEFEFVAKYS